MTRTHSSRVVAVGLDAMEPTLVHEMLDDGELPTLAALRARGLVAELEDPDDYRTGLVWEHFLTGRSSSTLHRTSAVGFDPASYSVWQDGARPWPPFWSGKDAPRTVVFDVPYAVPTADTADVVVVGWGGHDPGHPPCSRPAGLLDELDRRFGRHPAFNNDYQPIWHSLQAVDTLANGLVVGARRRVDAFAWLLEEFPDWELAMTVMSEPHSAGEQFWHGVDPHHPLAVADSAALSGRRLREVYRAVDDALARLLALLPDDVTVVVFSMHGIATNDADVASMVLLPEILHRWQTGAPRLRCQDADEWQSAGCPPIVPDNSWTVEVRRMLGMVPDRGLRQRLWARAPQPVRAAWRAGRRRRPTTSPPQVGTHGVLGRPYPPGVDEAVAGSRLSVDWQIPYAYRESWPSQRCFAIPTFYDGRVRLNLAGRERDGVVELADYERACTEVEQLLADLVDVRTGRPAVAEFLRPRADDPLDPAGADSDVVVVWGETTDAVRHPDLGVIGPVPFRRTGGHSPRGFAIVAGPDIGPGTATGNALDVLPTIATLLGTTSDRCDGRSLLAGTPTRG